MRIARGVCAGECLAEPSVKNLGCLNSVRGAEDVRRILVRRTRGGPRGDERISQNRSSDRPVRGTSGVPCCTGPLAAGSPGCAADAVIP